MPKTILGMVNEYLYKNIDLPLVSINREGKVILFNNLAAEVFNVDADSATNKKIWEIVKEEEFTKAMLTLMKEQAHTHKEFLLFLPSSVIFKAKLIPVENKDRRVIAALAVLRDYSNVHNLEKNIMHTLTEVSHKLKTPLTSIKGFIDTMMESNLSDKKMLQNFLAIMHEEANRMSRIINDTLNLTTYTSHGQKPETKPSNIVELVKQAAHLINTPELQKKIKIKLDFPKNMPLVELNRDHFMQAIINILDNSIKFSAPTGKKTKIDVKIINRNGAAIVEIQDNGIGISPRDQKQIFEKFFHTNSKHAGIGLGLSIVKQIIENHDGIITCKSSPGNGSAFTISIPVISPKQDQKKS